ncbi:MAG: histidine phosphatase family protein [Rhizomicrobium sp.]|jgi:probable phosphoglycerate mutase
MSMFESTTGRRRIYLMRHGHVDYLAPEVVRSRDTHGVPLTAQGRLEAEAAGRAFAHVSIDRAICSGLPRTRQTAELVLAQIENAPALETDSALAEIRGGRAGVKSRQELIRTMSFFFEKSGEPGATMLEGGETFADAQKRAVDALRALLCAPEWQQSLVIAHEGINRLILSWACRAGLAAAGAFEQDTGCINVLDFDMVPSDNGGSEIARVLVKAVNLTPYNYLKHGMNLTSLEAIFTRNASVADDSPF